MYCHSLTCSLQVVHLVQSLPENKVAWLMSQQQFTEALQFAREHGINMEVGGLAAWHFLY